MSATLLDVAAVRARFTALDRRLAFFDGPGGTQCPDEVIDAIAAYLRRDNANIGAPYETSARTTALVDHAHERAASFLGCAPGRGRVRAEHDRAELPADARLRADPRARRRGARHASRPRRERRAVARDPARHRDHGPLRRRHRRARARLRRPGAEALRQDARRRVPGGRELRRHGAGHPAGGRPRPRGRRPRLDRRRALRPARPDRRRGVGLRRPHLLALQVLRPPHGDGVRAGGAAAQLAPVQGAPRRRRAGRAPLRARHLPARAPGRARRRDRLRRLPRLGGDGRARARPRAALPRRPPGPRRRSTACRRWRAACRRSASRWEAHSARSVAEHLAAREIAVWWGNYYALETIRHLGLDEHDGAVRAGIVHYNTSDEIDRLLAALTELG